jgi:hypothetical protein
MRLAKWVEPDISRVGSYTASLALPWVTVQNVDSYWNRSNLPPRIEPNKLANPPLAHAKPLLNRCDSTMHDSGTRHRLI